MSLTRQRATIKGQLTKLENNLNTLTAERLAESDRVDKLETQREYVENQRVLLIDIQEKIILAAHQSEDSDLAKNEEKILSDLMDKCDTLDLIIRRLIRKAKNTGDDTDDSTLSLVNKILSENTKTMSKLMIQHQHQVDVLAEKLTKQGHSQRVKLPELKMKPFGGSYSEWPAFYDFFKCTIHDDDDLSDIKKFQYLKMSLTGDADSVISHLTVSDSNYQEAWELLTKRFHKPLSILKEHFHRFYTHPAMKEADEVKLRKLHTTYEESIRAAENMGATSKDAWLVHYATERIDPDTRELWAREKKEGELPTWREFSDFLSKRCDEMEACSRQKNPPAVTTSQPQSNQKKKPAYTKDSKPPVKSSFFNGSMGKCPICNIAPHPPWKCSKFLEQQPSQRILTVQKLKMCTNCLSTIHSSCDRGRCKVCQQLHNTLLHDPFIQMSAAQAVPSVNHTASTSGVQTTQAASAQSSSYSGVTVQPKVETTSSSDSQHTFTTGIGKHMLLPTVQVLAKGANGKLHKCRALLDGCSQVNFVTARFVDQLKVQRRQQGVNQITGVNNIATDVTSSADLHISSTYEDFQMSANFMVIDKIVERMPTEYVELDYNIPEHIELADPQFMKPNRIDLLLGADFDAKARRPGCMQDNSPVLLETAFGWVIQGAWTHPKDTQESQEFNNFLCFSTMNSDDSLEQIVQEFFEMESVGQKSSDLSIEETECEEYFTQTATRNPDGRYKVRYPVRDNIHALGDNRFIAEERFKQVEQRLQSKPVMKGHYMEFMRKMRDLNHLKPLPMNYVSSRPAYYLPHHGVVKMSSSSTPLRVVFDASCKTTSSLSLNSVLKVGPRLQQKIFGIMSRIRQYNYVIVGDVGMMFRQVEVDEDDQNLQRIIFRESPDEPLQTFLLTTVTYGLDCAPYLAIRVLKQIIQDHGHDYPAAKEKADQDFYVDDILTGAQTIPEAIELRNQLTALLNEGGFPLKKWISNSQQILDTIPPEDRETKTVLEFDSEKSFKTLGIIWNPITDTYTFQIKFKSGVINKRSVLSNMSRIYDPMGFLAPVTITAKIFMQKLWKLDPKKVLWDTPLDSSLQKEWITYQDDVRKLSILTIPRKFTSFDDVTDLQLIGFCDASKEAIAACIYVRTMNEEGQVSSHLLAAKTQIAPPSSHFSPRFELLAAILLTKLYKDVASALTVKIDDVKLFSDARVVLYWIHGDADRWMTFVRNRVVEIQKETPTSVWNYVGTKENPADLPSRGIKADELINNSLWWHGPDWICQQAPPEFEKQPSIEDVPEELLETRRVCALNIASNPFWEIINRYSSYSRLTRAVAYLTRFTHFIRNKHKGKCSVQRGPLTVDELTTARDSIVKAVQSQSFPEDIQNLADSGAVAKNSKIRSLHPFLDSKGLLRVGGRIDKATVPYDHKHPLLLPANHYFTDMVATHFLIGSPLTAIPEPTYDHIPINRLDQWQFTQHLLNHFWQRWHKEYLHTLQNRKKWQRVNPPIAINDLVLVKDDNLPPFRWKMGRIIEIHPGKDQLVRAVSLQTPNGITQRALSKICPLPKES